MSAYAGQSRFGVAPEILKGIPYEICFDDRANCRAVRNGGFEEPIRSAVDPSSLNVCYN